MLKSLGTTTNEHLDCFYCCKNQELERIMIEVKKLNVSTLYLNKDQSHKGRCILAYDKHATEIFQLDDQELQFFMKDVSNAAQTLHEVFQPDKINYAIYGDLVSHLHVHLVPKYAGSLEWGEAFVNSPLNKKLLDQASYQEILEIIQKNLHH
ncbi:HIT family protein [Pullulanibacillus sp. KACC 23026]|uniref:HIT family protein n=1 Tax=Pullulanibacillus sp. KACC 23026 TaxID=3028315 RepID=UPI0023AF2866|nr:HIT family protein [Pullulanibacillus sp. KACC 23026]WEG13464.1 HIT family protein [Pullulanibacillus sp. KACC 23026]